MEDKDIEMPKSVRIGYTDYKIEDMSREWAAAYTRQGDCCNAMRTIHVCSSMNDNPNTLLHELLHAIWWIYQIKDGDTEERQVHMLANALCQVMRDTPEVFDWLQANLHA